MSKRPKNSIVKSNPKRKYRIVHDISSDQIDSNPLVNPCEGGGSSSMKLNECSLQSEVIDKNASMILETDVTQHYVSSIDHSGSQNINQNTQILSIPKPRMRKTKNSNVCNSQKLHHPSDSHGYNISSPDNSQQFPITLLNNQSNMNTKFLYVHNIDNAITTESINQSTTNQSHILNSRSSNAYSSTNSNTLHNPLPNSKRRFRHVHNTENTITTESLNESTTRDLLHTLNPLSTNAVSSTNSRPPRKSLPNSERRFRQFHNISGDNDLVMQTINVPEHYLGLMNVQCTNCGARHFRGEKVSNKTTFNDCCSHGKVSLPSLPEPPLILRELFNGTHEKSNHFFQRIRHYNNSFSFASFNANLVNFNNRRPGPYCFKIQGQIYYQINTSLYPAENELPSYGQLFIVDPNEAIAHRLNSDSQLDREIVQAIDDAMRQYNRFADSYHMMKEEIEMMTRQNNGEEPELQLLFTLKKGLDKRRYNFQKTNEVAAVFSTSADGEIPESYVTIRTKNTKTLQYMSTMDGNVEPWTYPLFYPHGTTGWHDELKQVTNTARRVTRNAYFKYRIAIREEPNYFLMGRRLFQQWVVDSYVKIEKDKMNYLRSIQNELRVDSYEGLMEHLRNRASESNARIGKLFILPSSHVGSPRYMLQIYQDAMTIVRTFGKPDLFITMTCNPKWTEITENLGYGETASDRPDLVARVFELKKDELMRLIKKDKIFGEVQAYVYVIEYQKRGLPHVHLLLTLKPNSKITTPDIVDRYISAEIPSPIENPRLHDIIKTNMIHGPCGDWCLDEKKNCTKKYPKLFCDRTNMDEDGYPHYRRRNTQSYTRRDGFVFDNRHVVPHNKQLLLTFDSHINVEVVSSIRAVKYLYKYIFKGHDAAAVVVQDSESNQQTIIDHDEIKNYIEARYVSPPEACARIFNYEMHSRSHAITRLPVHLPNQQTVMVDDLNNENAIQAALNKQTMLTAYFALNEQDPQARKFTYAEIPSHYTFKKVDGRMSWSDRRAKFNVIGRMYSVSPTLNELFHLRLLLLSVKGAKSYEGLRTVNGIIHDTFVSACLALGLIEDDDEWKNAMHEAEIWMMPRQLRQLFVRILIHCRPIKPEELWEEFQDALAQDYSRSMPLQQARRRAYIQINTLLTQERSSLSSFPSMPQITDVDDTENDMPLAEHRAIGTAQYQKLNEKQKGVVDTILQIVSNGDVTEEPRCFFIDGPGGSGKTFVYTTLYHLLRSKEKKICTTAFTGIAATLLPHGKTVHKTFQLPFALYTDSSPSIKIQTKEAQTLRNADLFIWDEAPMAPRHALELVDTILKDIMNNRKPFGGKLMLLGGDFRQLLPVKKHATRSELVDLSIKYSRLWPSFSQFSLTQNMRTRPEEIDFAKFLLSVGDGSININDCEICLPDHCIASPSADIAEDMYGQAMREEQYDSITTWAILSARNVDVNEINRQVVELLDKSSEKIYTSINSVKNCDNGEIAEALLPEYLETLDPTCLPPHELRLRINTIVMLIRNLSINEGLCNGTRLQILELSNHLLKCQILTGDKSGNIVFINRITLYSEDDYPFTFGRRQFPIKLAFAMTINKSQGQTFEKIAIDLRRDIFNHGQLYVALSRVRSWDSLKIYLGTQRDSNVVKNFVYKELFNS